MPSPTTTFAATSLSFFLVWNNFFFSATGGMVGPVPGSQFNALWERVVGVSPPHTQCSQARHCHTGAELCDVKQAYFGNQKKYHCGWYLTRLTHHVSECQTYT